MSALENISYAKRVNSILESLVFYQSTFYAVAFILNKISGVWNMRWSLHILLLPETDR